MNYEKSSRMCGECARAQRYFWIKELPLSENRTMLQLKLLPILLEAKHKKNPKTLIIPYRWFCRFLLSVSMHHKWRILKVSVLSWAYLSYGTASVRALDEQLGYLCFHIHKEINTGPSLFIYNRKRYGFELINIIFEIFQPVEKPNKNQ